MPEIERRLDMDELTDSTDRCIVCLTELRSPAMPTDLDTLHWPNDATVFTSHGNYGSTVFDPADDRVALRVLICDECMRKRADEGVIEWYTSQHRQSIIRREVWKLHDGRN